jgi:endonuclease YncB( thermonuclease family)
MSDLRAPAGFVWQFPAVIDRVVDGDSLEVHVLQSAGRVEHGVNVRLEGCNAIELKAEFGREARTYLAALAPPGTAIMLLHRKREKFGRLLARAILADGTDLSTALLTAKASDGTTPLAVPYSG